jgi:hypothetical protein
MPFVTINDLAPIRLLRQVGRITDNELAKLLATERAFKLRRAALDERWIDVLDLRQFEAMTAGQRQMCAEWLADNVALISKATLGLALTVPPELEQRARLFTDPLDHIAVPTRITNDLDTALHWALELAYDEDVFLDPSLVIGGVDAFRLTIR